MSDAQPARHMAISVLMAILLTAVSTTATPRQSPEPAAQGGQIGDGAREAGLRRGAESPQAPQGRLARNALAHPSHHRALLTTDKRAIQCSGRRNARVAVKMEWDSSSRDGELQIQVQGSVALGLVHTISNPNPDYTGKKGRRTYYFCSHNIGVKAQEVGVKLTNRESSPHWHLDWVKVYLKKKCFYFRFNKLIDDFTQWYWEDQPTECKT